MSSSPFLQRLRQELEADLAPEVETTLRVAVLAAAGNPRVMICKTLAISDAECKMALVRIKRVATRWNT